MISWTLRIQTLGKFPILIIVKYLSMIELNRSLIWPSQKWDWEYKLKMFLTFSCQSLDELVPGWSLVHGVNNKMVSRDGKRDWDPHKGNLCSNLTQHCSYPASKKPNSRVIRKQTNLFLNINSFRLQHSVKYPLPSLKFSWDRIVHQSESLNSLRPRSRVWAAQEMSEQR